MALARPVHAPETAERTKVGAVAARVAVGSAAQGDQESAVKIIWSKLPVP